ncbi:FHA domain-containing protein [Aristaeella lactis]|uniref:Zn-finger protein n=1 Tax=Aristaeella lactis TaxID=3046383 RepID=A0AC61PLK5_9FIRM|nr:FHA domain-containing protein [Aristaeella lactis]QUA54665.1 FHA domain-containing protein [Aristaeella lactis]SMC63659.1 Zn-finger protein [Aristaeella lactis]
MEKFKICPLCGKRNAPIALECEVCETDISTIRPMDEETIKTSIDAAEQPSTIPLTMARICEECGFRNPPNSRKCQQCGEDISDVIPTKVESVKRIHFILSSLDGEFAFPIPEGKTIIGREAAMSEYLTNKCFVSRNHAKIILENGKITVENISKTNYTYINNEKITGDTVELHDGDIMGLGGNEKDGKRQDQAAYFMVRIGSCI